jgi:cell division protein FtsB
VYKLIAFLLVLIAALQYRLWLGDGGIHEYRETQARLADMEQDIERRRARNAALEADVRDLKEGTEAIEERARHELGMVKPGETFIQVYEAPHPESEGTRESHIIDDVSARQPSAKKAATAASKPPASKKRKSTKSRAANVKPKQQ